MHILSPSPFAGVVVSRGESVCEADRKVCERVHAPGDFYERRSESLMISRSAVHFRLCASSVRDTRRQKLRAVVSGASNHFSLHETTRCHSAQSLGSRILAAGLLPLPQLRFFCHGKATLTEIKAQAQRFREKSFAAWTPQIEGIHASLLGAAHLSHAVTILINETDEGLVSKSLQMKRNAFLKSPASVSRAYTGAEGEQA